MILSYGSQRDYDGMGGSAESTWSPQDFAELHAFMTKFNQDLEASGELVETRGLTAPVHTRRIGNRNGTPFVTDGPFAETEEVLAGYWVVDVASFDRATEIAERLRDCPGPAAAVADAYADVRPIAESADEL
ncbi:YciI family protein [Nocardia macrotermitis]|nr:YciI family protein [Nocardia macrotermitis]